jgi:hypothetical protein
MELKNSMTQKGVTTLIFDAANEINTHNIISELTDNKILGGDINVVLSELNEFENAIVSIHEPFQNFFIPTPNQNIASISKFISLSLSKILTICNDNNICAIINTQKYKSSQQHYTGGKGVVYISNFVGVIDGDIINVQKSRYCEPKKYNVNEIFLKSIRRKKLIEIKEKLNNI